MKYLLPILLIVTAAYSQSLEIVDNETNEPIPFATVLLLKADKVVSGNYCDEKGKIVLGYDVVYDVARFTCLGFADRDVKKTDMADGAVALQKVSYPLEEVAVSVTAPQVTLGEFDAKRKRWFMLERQHTAAVFFANHYGEPAYIRSLMVKLGKVTHKTAVRVRMYGRYDFQREIYVGDSIYTYPSYIPQKELLNENVIIYIEPQKKGTVAIDLSGYALELPPEGAFIALECVGYFDEKDELLLDVAKPTQFEMHSTAADDYCLKYNLEGWWININQWIKSDFIYVFGKEAGKNTLWAPTFGLRVDRPE